MKWKKNSLKISSIAFAVLVSVILFIAGCKQWNEDTGEGNGTLTLDISSIQQQLGYQSGDASNAQVSDATSDSGRFHVDSEAATQVKALLVGAVIVRSRNTPYTAQIPITDELANAFEDDIINSINYFALVPLPASAADSNISFAAPPEEAGNWQVVVIGAKTELTTLASIADDENSNTAIYYGFSENFINTADDIGDLSLTLKRACLKEGPPKGCAFYHEFWDKDPVVTAAVEITGVTIGGVDVVDSGFPYIVRGNPEGDEVSVSDAISVLEGFKEGNENQQVTVKVSVTHMMNSLESSACIALRDQASKPTVAELEAACEVQQNELTVKIAITD